MKCGWVDVFKDELDSVIEVVHLGKVICRVRFEREE